MAPSEADQLVLSDDPQHPANLICELCRKFYTLGWVGHLSCVNYSVAYRKHDFSKRWCETRY